MDWISLLRSQQKDFLRRVKKIESHEATFLAASIFGCHAERLEFRESQFLQMLDIARQKAVVSSQNLAFDLDQYGQQQQENCRDVNALMQRLQPQFENYYFCEQICEHILNFCFPQKFTLLTNTINLHSGDFSLENINQKIEIATNYVLKNKFSYQLAGKPEFRLQIHIHDSHNLQNLDYQKISWQIKPNDFQNHQILLFVNREINPNYSHEQDVTLCGFLLPQLLNLPSTTLQIETSELLYSGGLSWCIDWLQTYNESTPNSTTPATSKTTQPKIATQVISSHRHTLVYKHPLKSLIGDWECWQILTGHTRGINCLAITPENPLYGSPSLLATGSRGEIKLWNLTRGELICTLSEYQWSRSGWVDEVNCLTFSQDGRMLVSGSADATIKIWHVGARDLVDILHSPGGAVRCMSFTPNQRILVTGGEDRKILFWDLRRRETEIRLSVPGIGIHALTFDQNGEKLLVGCYQQVQIWQTSTSVDFPGFPSQPQQQIKAHSDIVRALAVSQDGNYLVSGGRRQNIKIWKLATGELIRTLTGHQDSIHAIAIAPIPANANSNATGHIIASGSADRTIRLWHLETGEHLATFHGHNHTVTALTFTPSAEIIVSTSLDKTIRIWQRND